jgi:hypothetical protein
VGRPLRRGFDPLNRMRKLRCWLLGHRWELPPDWLRPRINPMVACPLYCPRCRVVKGICFWIKP